MTIYLYKKTHLKTGYQYLGKTVAKDPHAYEGSGKLWKRHIKKHGYDVKTEVLKECATQKEITYWGKYYSDLWNVVEDSNWANLVPEQGDGGKRDWNKQSRDRVSKSLKGLKRGNTTNYSKAQQRDRYLRREEQLRWHSNPDNRTKKLETMRQHIWSNPEWREKMSKKMSKLKWCNDGKRNYRKEVIPEGFRPGRLT